MISRAICSTMWNNNLCTLMWNMWNCGCCQGLPVPWCRPPAYWVGSSSPLTASHLDSPSFGLRSVYNKPVDQNQHILQKIWGTTENITWKCWLAWILCCMFSMLLLSFCVPFIRPSAMFSHPLLTKQKRRSPIFWSEFCQWKVVIDCIQNRYME